MAAVDMNVMNPLTKAHWKGVQVLILGLGQYPQGSGVSAALAFARAGACVTVTDLKSAIDLGANVRRLKRFSNVRFVFGRHDLNDVKTADLIVANPRVRPNSPEMRLARKMGKKIASDISIFLDHCSATVIAVTGTRGKSTTSSLIAAMLRASGIRVWLGGNILVSPLTFLSRVRPKDVVVLELSSWQCESLAFVHRVPRIAVITNLMRDHLNAYDGMEDYAEAKAQIFRHQSSGDLLIVNDADAYGCAWAQEAPGTVKRFGTRKGLDARVAGGAIYVGASRVIRLEEMRLLGSHNAQNASAAAIAAAEAGASVPGIQKTLRTFVPLPHRLETVRLRRGVRFVNDTTATTPDGTIAAIRALAPITKRLWLIAGGADKELEYRPLGEEIARVRRSISILLLPGNASKKMRRELIALRIAYESVPSVEDAVRIAETRAVRGDAVLLSPAAASFNQFKNEFERGETFIRAVKKLR